MIIFISILECNFFFGSNFNFFSLRHTNKLRDKLNNDHYFIKEPTPKIVAIIN